MKPMKPNYRTPNYPGLGLHERGFGLGEIKPI